MMCYLQYWEESQRGWGLRMNGCSIHIDAIVHQDYVDTIYRDRTFYEYIPEEYDRTIGDPIKVDISDKLSEILNKKGTIRLSEVETNNLIKLGDIKL